ncbi:conserved domain protein [Bacteroides clarus YIT 12056]|uniref:Conserved domain protein n=1 Tax=Bacteroides clarus YIT 12056 TaxID=762984 RepID=A0ABP2KNA3_9BACE|nr:conserved domain protein [Bacteroides clarus YIT 12056]
MTPFTPPKITSKQVWNDLFFYYILLIILFVYILQSAVMDISLQCGKSA